MEVRERVLSAKAKLNRLVDATLLVIRLRASNEIVVYSNTIAGQVPTSYGAHAFLTMQRAMYEQELIRLCALWDTASSAELARQRDSIPAVAWLLNDRQVIDAVVEKTRATHSVRGTRIIEPPQDETMRTFMEDGMQRAREEFARQRAETARGWLTEALDRIQDVCSGNVFWGGRAPDVL